MTDEPEPAHTAMVPMRFEPTVELKISSYIKKVMTCEAHSLLG